MTEDDMGFFGRAINLGLGILAERRQRLEREEERRVDTRRAEQARQTNPPLRPTPKTQVEVIEVERKAGKIVGLKVNGLPMDLKSEAGKRTLDRLIREGRLSR